MQLDWNIYRSWPALRWLNPRLGPNAADTTPIISSWSLIIQDTDNKPEFRRFDVSNDTSPITIRMEVKRYSITDNLSSPNKLIISHPTDKSLRVLETNMSGSGRLHQRLQRLLDAHGLPTSSRLIGKIEFSLLIRAMTLARRIHNVRQLI